MTLTEKQVDSLRAALRARRAALLVEVGDDAARVRALPFAALASETPDRGDEAAADAMADVAQAELSRDLGELRQVESALERFDIGRYGFCKECGVEIAFARLLASPSAARCATCQERHERLRAAPARL